jgi:hypothetical protein
MCAPALLKGMRIAQPGSRGWVEHLRVFHFFKYFLRSSTAHSFRDVEIKFGADINAK